MQVEGLTIRRAEAADCDALYEMFASPKLYANTLQLPYPSREMWRRRLAEAGNETPNLGDKVVGMFSLHTITRPRRNHAAAVGLTVDDAWHGKGIGSALMHAGID